MKKLNFEKLTAEVMKFVTRRERENRIMSDEDDDED